MSNRATPVLFAYTTCFLPRLPRDVLSRYVTLPCRLCIVSADKASVRSRLPLTCNATLMLVLVVLVVGLLTGTLHQCFSGGMGAGWWFISIPVNYTICHASVNALTRERVDGLLGRWRCRWSEYGAYGFFL